VSISDEQSLMATNGTRSNHEDVVSLLDIASSATIVKDYSEPTGGSGFVVSVQTDSTQSSTTKTSTSTSISAFPTILSSDSSDNLTPTITSASDFGQGSVPESVTVTTIPTILMASGTQAFLTATYCNPTYVLPGCYVSSTPGPTSGSYVPSPSRANRLLNDRKTLPLTVVQLGVSAAVLIFWSL
jgi:hypothetical protein